MRKLKIGNMRSFARDDWWLHESNKYKPVSAEEEANLSRDKLIKHNLRFAISVAKQYAYTNIPIEDLIQYANIGLVKAADLWDPTRGFKFISYAVWWIRQTIMANVKNAKKKIIQIRKTTLAHQQLKSTVKNAIKETDKAVLAGNKELADKSLKKAIKALDNAKVKGLVHKNKVDREKSRLTKKVNTMEVK